MAVLVPESLDDLISTKEAANECGVGMSTISNWVKRGYLEARGLDERNRPLYRRVDVMRVARDTRRRATGPARTG